MTLGLSSEQCCPSGSKWRLSPESWKCEARRPGMRQVVGGNACLLEKRGHFATPTLTGSAPAAVSTTGNKFA